MALAIYEEISLAGLSKDWDNKAFMVFKPFGDKEESKLSTIRKKYKVKTEAQILANPDAAEALGHEVLGFLETNFISGKVYDGEYGSQFKLRPATKEDIRPVFYADTDRFDSLLNPSTKSRKPLPSKKS